MYPDIQTLALNIRKSAILMTHLGQSSHIGSILSCTDIIASLYGGVMNINPDKPELEDRDRFILSKGHAGAAVYAVLAELGFFDKSKLRDHYKNGSVFSGHLSHKGVPGVELSTGSLGHGLGVACGRAYAAKIDNKKHKNFVLMSDGETDEGSVWEAAMFAGHFKLNNLIALIDYNKIQSLGSVEKTMTLEPYEKKWESFNWKVKRVDGHDVNLLVKELNNLTNEDKPICFICDTIKGKGVSFMENSVLWHYRSPNKKEYEDAIRELEDS
jgi:transketolase